MIDFFNYFVLHLQNPIERPLLLLSELNEYEIHRDSKVNL